MLGAPELSTQEHVTLSDGAGAAAARAGRRGAGWSHRRYGPAAATRAQHALPQPCLLTCASCTHKPRRCTSRRGQGYTAPLPIKSGPAAARAVVGESDTKGEVHTDGGDESKFQGNLCKGCPEALSRKGWQGQSEGARPDLLKKEGGLGRQQQHAPQCEVVVRSTTRKGIRDEARLD